MKKTLFLGIVTLIVSNLNGQITLKHTFSGNITEIVNTHHKTLYCNSFTNGNQFNFYNEDYSFYKTVTVVPPYGCKVFFINNVSDNLFNTDNDLEFTCAFFDTLNNHYKLQLINENGTVIKDFGSVANWGIPHKTVNNDVRFLVTRYVTFPTVTETEIYSLPGSIASTKSLVSEANEEAPYPNPAKNFITLKYNLNQSEIENLQIFNKLGQIIETKQIGGAFDKIIIDISSYPSGQYFYKYKTITQSFIVE